MFELCTFYGKNSCHQQRISISKVLRLVPQLVNKSPYTLVLWKEGLNFKDVEGCWTSKMKKSFVIEQLEHFITTMLSIFLLMLKKYLFPLFIKYFVPTILVSSDKCNLAPVVWSIYCVYSEKVEQLCSIIHSIMYFYN